PTAKNHAGVSGRPRGCKETRQRARRLLRTSWEVTDHDTADLRDARHRGNRFTVAVRCARSSTRTSSTATSPAASPPTATTDLTGTWRGSAWELGGGIAAARTDATLQLDPDGTWSAHWKTNQGKEQAASGT